MASAQEILQAFNTHGSKTKAAEALGIPRTTFNDRFAKAKQEVKVKKTEPVDAEGIQIRRAHDRNNELTEKLKRVQQRVIGLEDELNVFKNLKKAIVEPVQWLPRPSISKKTRLTPILFTSDFQCGEVIRAEEIDGMNAYDKDIFAVRYNRLIEATIDFSEHHIGRSEFPGIIYLRGGDAISGGIHDELAETDDVSAIPACRWLFQHEREGIRRLKDKFGRVKVISIPGNHGRTTVERRSKGYAEKSFETILSWWLETAFQDIPEVTFATPASGDAFFKVEGHNFLMSHGDRMAARGGTGFIGPAANIAKGHQKLRSNWSATGVGIDYVLTGHLHTSAMLPGGYANGSLAGYSEYARDLRATPDAAKQWLLFAHEKRGVAQAFEVQCSDKPMRTIDL